MKPSFCGNRCTVQHRPKIKVFFFEVYILNVCSLKEIILVFFNFYLCSDQFKVNGRRLEVCLHSFGVPVGCNFQQNGRLAPAYFSPNYKYFDQLLQTIKNKTTVLILAFKVFYKHQFDHWFLYLMQKGITTFRWKFFVSQCRKISSRSLSVFQKISGIEKR